MNITTESTQLLRERMADLKTAALSPDDAGGHSTVRKYWQVSGELRALDAICNAMRPCLSEDCQERAAANALLRNLPNLPHELANVILQHLLIGNRAGITDILDNYSSEVQT